MNHFEMIIFTYYKLHILVFKAQKNGFQIISIHRNKLSICEINKQILSQLVFTD